MDRVEAAVRELVEAIRAEVQPVGPVPERLLSIREAADILGIGRSHLYEIMRPGQLRSVKVRRRHLIPASAIDEYIAALTQAA